MTQTIRHTFRFINLFIVAGAFLLIDEARLTQVVMGMSFLYLALVGGLLLWDVGSRVKAGTGLHEWFYYGTAMGQDTTVSPASGLPSSSSSGFIFLVWCTLGLALIA